MCIRDRYMGNITALETDLQSPANTLAENFIEAVLPVIRKAVAFLTSVFPQNQEFKDSLANHEFYEDETEFNFYQTLGLPNLDLRSILEDHKLRINDWLTEAKIPFLQNNMSYLYRIYKHGSLFFRLVQLEDKYSDLHKTYIQKRCEICNDFPKRMSYSICLICSAIMCVRACKNRNELEIQEGNLNAHATERHCGSSIFMDLLDTRIYMISRPRSARMDALYTDKFGQPFSLRGDWTRYYLDSKYYNSLKEIIEQNRIAQEIEYYKMKHNTHEGDLVF
eukprot:TRINITY_DN29289_c0_g1_i1.p1 TRINITY_DN29289_c0_g1~~TRINITY_DN29289_c0_g1_i1.p1  ORF type:complete len:299 (+),score=39.17 TRINITY_DN29289_c0_g1_i1:61-897(+)